MFTFTPLLRECLSFASGLAVGQSAGGRVSSAGPPFGTACWCVPGVGVQRTDGSYSLLSFWEY